MSENEDSDISNHDPYEILVPDTSTLSVDPKTSEMIATFRELRKISLRNIKKMENSLRNINELEAFNPSTDNVLKESFQDIVTSFQILQNHVKNLIAFNSAGCKEAPLVPPLDISLTVVSSKIPEQSIPPLDNTLSIIPLENQESSDGVSLPTVDSENPQFLSSDYIDLSDNVRNPQPSTSSQIEKEKPPRSFSFQTVLDTSQSSLNTGRHKYLLRPRPINVNYQNKSLSASKSSEPELGRGNLISSTTARNDPSNQEYYTSSNSESSSESIGVTTSSTDHKSLPSTHAVQYAISVSHISSTEQLSNSSGSLAPVTRIRSIKSYHILLREEIKSALKRLKPPVFPSECIKIQKVLFNLFFHLINELDDFIEFVEGKEKTSCSELPLIEKLIYVKGNFSLMGKTILFRSKIRNCERMIQILKPYRLYAVESLLDEHSEHALPQLATSMDYLGRSSIQFRNLTKKNKVSQELLDFIAELNEQVVLLLCSCRDTTRAIVDYCYQAKLSSLDGILHSFLDYLLWMATWFIELRQQYTNYMNDGTRVTTRKLLKVKITVAFELKKFAMSVLDKNSRFWDLI